MINRVDSHNTEFVVVSPRPVLDHFRNNRCSKDLFGIHVVERDCGCVWVGGSLCPNGCIVLFWMRENSLSAVSLSLEIFCSKIHRKKLCSIGILFVQNDLSVRRNAYVVQLNLLRRRSSLVD